MPCNLNKICVITVGYNRPDAMNRLLQSLKKADYDEEVDLLISIDKGQRQQEIKDLADEFVWPYGDKRVRAFPERQGLRSHIIQCGDITEDYRAVIVLEDDITVSRGFFTYAKQCLNKYETNDSVAGISLYKHHINVGTRNFFEPAFAGHDVFFMQYAQSWGQCWTRNMWQGFKSWYLENVDTYFAPGNPSLVNIPDNVVNWDGHSWLKYYISYTVEKNKFFVYPYHSLTTNHSEAGQHRSESGCGDYMVSMLEGAMEYRLPELDGNAIRYDAFFERVGMSVPGYEDKSVILDLYGNKKDFSKGDVLISSASHPYGVLSSWRLKYRPQENNCIFQEAGQGLYVYDLHTQEAAPAVTDVKIRARYDTKTLSWKRLLALGLDGVKKAIKSRLVR